MSPCLNCRLWPKGIGMRKTPAVASLMTPMRTVALRMRCQRHLMRSPSMSLNESRRSLCFWRLP